MFQFAMIAITLIGVALCYRRLGQIQRTVEKIWYNLPDKKQLFGLLILLAAATSAAAGERVQMMHLGPEVRGWYKNPDGSCVQCSIGMCGCHCNDPNAASLLWDTEYGAAVRGGSDPRRVEAYCDRRGIKAWSVTGLDRTIPMMKWACRTGRFAAVGCGTQHFQTLYGYDPDRNVWLICNNNSTHRIDEYPNDRFIQEHKASGPWCVILEKPSSPPPRFAKYWN